MDAMTKNAGLVTTSYNRIKQYLKQGLAQGRWSPGELMPSESELVAQFSVSRMTVNRALRELQTEGLIQRLQGVGTFAAQLHRLSSTLSIEDMQEHIQSRGYRHRMALEYRRIEHAPEDVMKRLRLNPLTPMFHSLAIHFEDEIPLQLEDRWVNPEVVPDYLNADLSKITPTQYLLRVAPMWEASYTIEAAIPTQIEAQHLKIDACEPCLIVTRWTISRGAPVTLVRLVHPGNHYILEGSFKP